MKKLLLLLLMVPAPSVFAEACPHTEYAELKDMRQDELQAKYCELKGYQESKEQEAFKLARSGAGAMVSGQYLQYSSQCGSEAKRVAELLERSFSAAPQQCQANEGTQSSPDAVEE